MAAGRRPGNKPPMTTRAGRSIGPPVVQVVAGDLGLRAMVALVSIERPARSAGTKCVGHPRWRGRSHIRKEPAVPSVSHLAPTYLGLDVHKDTISVAILAPDRDGPDIERIAHDEASIRRLVGRFPDPRLLRACYEAGPTGYELARLLDSARALRGDCALADPQGPRATRSRPTGARARTPRTSSSPRSPGSSPGSCGRRCWWPSDDQTSGHLARRQGDRQLHDAPGRRRCRTDPRQYYATAMPERA
jgi:hypothetical protein